MESQRRHRVSPRTEELIQQLARLLSDNVKTSQNSTKLHNLLADLRKSKEVTLIFDYDLDTQYTYAINLNTLDRLYINLTEGCFMDDEDVVRPITNVHIGIIQQQTEVEKDISKEYRKGKITTEQMKEIYVDYYKEHPVPEPYHVYERQVIRKDLYRGYKGPEISKTN